MLGLAHPVLESSVACSLNWQRNLASASAPLHCCGYKLQQNGFFHFPEHSSRYVSFSTDRKWFLSGIVPMVFLKVFLPGRPAHLPRGHKPTDLRDGMPVA